MLTAHEMELYRMEAKLVKSMADATRLVILNELLSGEKSVSELAESLSVSQSIVSRHLSVLRDGEVVKFRREGTNIFYSLADPRIGDTCGLVHAILMELLQKQKEFANSIIPDSGLLLQPG